MEKGDEESVSVYIKGMEKPRACLICRFNFYSECILTGSSTSAAGLNNGTRKNCPVLSVPEHGRLIDADKIPERYAEVRDLAPTIIPADKEGE